jgi:ubiquinone/menaquinone biosynthesis C-methylase UbiE
MNEKTYLPALAYRPLTPVYDIAVKLATREYEFKRALLKQAALQTHHQVLDLGCGTGTLALLIKQRDPYIHITGIDADPTVLRLARGKSELEDFGIQFDQGHSTELPYPDNHFDRVLSTLFFHHLRTEDKRQTLKEVNRVLKPGGELHVADWGKPTGMLMRLAFLPIQALDGFEVTEDSVAGRLPKQMLEAGLREAHEKRIFSTPMGTISLYRAVKPA